MSHVTDDLKDGASGADLNPFWEAIGCAHPARRVLTCDSQRLVSVWPSQRGAGGRPWARRVAAGGATGAGVWRALACTVARGCGVGLRVSLAHVPSFFAPRLPHPHAARWPAPTRARWDQVRGTTQQSYRFVHARHAVASRSIFTPVGVNSISSHHMHVRLAKPPVCARSPRCQPFNIYPGRGQFDFVRPSARTPHDTVPPPPATTAPCAMLRANTATAPRRAHATPRAGASKGDAEQVEQAKASGADAVAGAFLTVEADLDLEYDCVVIGSGAG